MENSLAAGKRLATRVVLVQTAVAVVVGLACLPLGSKAALGAFAAGLLVAIGTVTLALRVFLAAPAGSGRTMARFAVGTVLKWAVMLIGLYLIIAVWKLPPLPSLGGLVAALLVNVVALKFER